MFDSIIQQAQEKFNLGDKGGSLLASLLGLIANPANGGFAGFVGRFRDAGMGDAVDSWMGGDEKAELSDAQVEAALGAETVDQVAEQSGVERATALSALGFMTPHVVDALTPDGEAPDEASLLSKVTGALKQYGGAVGAAILGGLGAAGALASGAAGKVGDAAGAVGDAGKAVLGAGADAAGKVGDAVGGAVGAGVDAGKAAVGKGAELVGDAAGAVGDAGKAAIGAVGDTVGGAIGRVGDAFDGDGDRGGLLRWLIPLILLGLLIVLGYWFCTSKSTPVANVANGNANAAKSNANTNAAAAKTVDSSFRIEAKDGKYIVSGVVSDQKAFDEIKAKLDAQFGAGNVDYAGLKIDPNAKPFAAGWWDNFQKLLPSLKDWKTGALAFAGGAITEAVGVPAAVLDQLKSLFAGWTLPASIGSAADETNRALTEVSLPNGTKLQAYPGGIEDQLVKFIGSDEYKNATADSLKDRWFSFDDLNFKFGGTELVPESKRQLDNIVAILKAFPDVKIKIGGYTDKKGDDAKNKKLSDDRAKAVKAALEKAGVGAQVPEAEGYGEQFAKVPDTASDEERKADRKTSVRLLKQ